MKVYCTPGVRPPIVTPTPVPEAIPLCHTSVPPFGLLVVSIFAPDPAGGF